MEHREEITHAGLKKLRRIIVDPEILFQSGRVIKLMGDGTLAEFPSAVGALQCAMGIQTKISAKASKDDDVAAIQLRIGLHVGDVIDEGGDIYGDGVNATARLEGLAEPGGIVLSKQVHDHIGDRIDVQFTFLGEQTVKNIARPIEANKVDLSSASLSKTMIQFGQYSIDLARFGFYKSGERIAVKPKVFDLLVYLARNNGRTVRKEEIFTEVWSGRIVSDAALSSQIKAVRKAVGDDGTS